MPVDPTRTLEFEGSPRKLWLLTLGSVAMTAGAGAVLFIGLGSGATYEILAGAAGVLFFGATTVLIAWQAITLRGPVVSMTPTGIRDKRLAAREIPWLAISRISTWEYMGQPIMVLTVAPAVEAGLGLSTIARRTRKANRALGADGLCITAQGLAVGYDELLAAAETYAEAAQRNHRGPEA